MNIVKKIALGTMSVMFVASATHAQSLEDAKKAVNAEQFQKAKSLFANLVKNQPSPENYFYYGDLYLQLNMPDSAKAVFQKGIAADEKGKYKLNQIGLGTVNLFEKNATAAQENFSKATADMRKKDFQEYIYIGKAYTYEDSRDLTKAFEWFDKAKENGEKDPELHISMGNAYKAQNKNSEAVAEYQRAMNLKDNLLGVEVNIGEIWTQAFNFELAESTLKGVIAKDANYGPAYRALAENYYRWTSAAPARKPEFLTKAKESYSKYLDLTDRSVDSRYRYLIFLLNAGDYAGLEKAATEFINSPGYNKEYILAKRFKGYASIEDSNTQQGIETLNSFIAEVDAKRIIADDYLYLGKAYQAEKQDSLAILNYVKGYDLDTTNNEVLGNIAKTYFSAKQYDKAANYYGKLTKLPKASFVDWFYLGYSNYFHYANLVNNKSKDTLEIKRTLLEADSAFTYVAEKAVNADAYLYLARVEYYLNPITENDKVKAAFDKFIEITLAKETLTDANKKNLSEAYSSQGAYYIKTDKVKAKEYFDKALALTPDNQQIKDALNAIKASK
ncbi:tetratricopeptide repeat protein [Pedobacter arcticus]|uniref:tetratricopeptide repeat protein n=1 Tax=Pedobacter arcticus TaxID=752140 RepID=UPI0004746851|nr:tetratricopeptide repeat protein [Pedobacter arcticus]